MNFEGVDLESQQSANRHGGRLRKYAAPHRRCVPNTGVSIEALSALIVFALVQTDGNRTHAAPAPEPDAQRAALPDAQTQP